MGDPEPSFPQIGSGRKTYQMLTPNSRPTPAVITIAAAPQNRTRNVAGVRGAPPASAPKAPRPASARSVTPTTYQMMPSVGASAAAATRPKAKVKSSAESLAKVARSA